MAPGSRSVLPVDIERAVLFFIVLGSLWGLFIGAVGPVAGDLPVYPVRLLSFVTFSGAALLGLRRGRPGAGAVMVLIFTWWWVLPLVDLVIETDLGYSSRATMGILLMMLVIILPSVVGVAMRQLSWGLAALAGVWGLVTGVATGEQLLSVLDQSFSLMLGGLLGNAVVANYIQRVNRSNDFQRAVADCSHALLTKPDDEAIERSLDAIAAFLPSSVAFADLWKAEGQQDLKVSALLNGEGAVDLLSSSEFGVRDCLSASVSAGLIRLETGDRDPCAEAVVRAGFGALLAVPVMVDGETVGAVGLLAQSIPLGVDAEVQSLIERTADMMGAYLAGVRANRRLQDLVDSKDEFVTSVSHELRTPLAAVVGMSAELTQDRAMDPEMQSELIEIIAEQSREVGDLVDDLLVVARSDIGTLVLSRSKLDLRSEVDSVVSALRRILDGKSVSITGSACAWGDPLRTRQIIRNLVSNAARYGGSTIDITVGEHDDHGHIRVGDDGVGIPADSVDMVFDAYTRAHSVPTQPGSVGIGLAVSRRLARMMGGDVVYDHNGTPAFELRLPRAYGFVGS